MGGCGLGAMEHTRRRHAEYSVMPHWGMSVQYTGNVSSYSQKGKVF